VCEIKRYELLVGHVPSRVGGVEELGESRSGGGCLEGSEPIESAPYLCQ